MSKISLNSFKAQEARLRHQRRVSSVTSVVIAILVVALVMVILGIILMPSWRSHTEPVVAYAVPSPSEEIVSKKTFSTQRSKPSSPASAMATVIAANVQSPTAIPVPEVVVDEPSTDFGTGDDFGDGWGSDDGDGWGEGGGTTFFRQQVKAQRVAYVIDYSQSMGGERDKLMRKELAKSIGQVGVGMQFQMIFFAGPAWVAGSDLENPKAKRSNVVTLDGERFKWKSNGKAHDWEPAGRKQVPEWISGAPGPREEAKRLVQSTPLAWGTNWENPLEMALSMEPPPQVIFFMTDGVAGGDPVQVAKRLGQRAKTKGTIINTVAMMEPKAEAAMKELAKRTGGQFSIVRPGGKVEVVPAK